MFSTVSDQLSLHANAYGGRISFENKADQVNGVPNIQGRITLGVTAYIMHYDKRQGVIIALILVPDYLEL